MDDDPANRLTLCVLLEEEGYEVHDAPSFEHAKEKMRARSFDAIVLDRGLGPCDGLELVPLARASALPTRIVVLSGSEATGDSISGVNAWLVKGRDLSTLIDALR